MRRGCCRQTVPAVVCTVERAAFAVKAEAPLQPYTNGEWKQHASEDVAFAMTSHPYTQILLWYQHQPYCDSEFLLSPRSQASKGQKRQIALLPPNLYQSHHRQRRSGSETLKTINSYESTNTSNRPDFLVRIVYFTRFPRYQMPSFLFLYAPQFRLQPDVCCELPRVGIQYELSQVA